MSWRVLSALEKNIQDPINDPLTPILPGQGSHFAPPFLRFRAWSLPSTTSQLETTQREGTGPGFPRTRRLGYRNKEGGTEGSRPEARRGGRGSASPPDAQQRPGFMHLHVTHGAVLVGLQVAHDAGFADLGDTERGRSQSPLGNQAQPPAPSPFVQVQVSLLHLVQQFRPVQRANVVVFSERADAPYPSLAEDSLMCLCVWIRPVSCVMYMVSPRSQASLMEYKTTASISQGP